MDDLLIIPLMLLPLIIGFVFWLILTHIEIKIEVEEKNEHE